MDVGAQEKQSVAVEAYDRTLALSPNDIEALASKGQCGAELRKVFAPRIASQS
ncbi:MAG: hypothetical protein JWO80_839 [Bryobacterales bacterium]|nr:hypothetical protein [Bryobacterales bacterium]